MFAFLTRHRKPSPRRHSHTRLSLECLESRYCPSAPQITSLPATPLPGQQVQLSGAVTDQSPQSADISFSGAASASVQASAAVIDLTAAPSITLSIAYGTQREVTVSGQVTDQNAGGLTVSITGVISGSVVTDSSGNFSFTAIASGLGDIQAVTTNLMGLQSNTAVVTATRDKPVITAFSSSALPAAGCYLLQGTVTDSSVAGLVINFGGPTEAQSVQATVEADGSFSVEVELAAGFSGNISAQTTDWWGLTSDKVYTFIS